MNIFRLAGDMTHLASVLVLLLKIHTIKSCAGISLKTQELYAVVFVTRYLDIFTDFISLYNTVMKLIFLGSSLSIVWYMRHHKIVRRSYDKDQDTFRHYFLVLPCILLALLIHKEFTFREVMWTFSIYLEAVAILPQLVLLQRTRNIDNLTGQYVFLLGAYRGLYILNWIYRYFTEPHYVQWIGAGFGSKLSFGSGFIHLRIKLPGKDSAGVVTAFYLTSNSNNHDELDFEFLGNREGKPITLQTNVFANGEGNREQRIYLWFDPIADFHTYGILWNQHQIVFYVDDVPIRVFKNNANIGVSYPTQPMQVEASLWDGESWATDGGRTKTNWSQAPFQAHFQGFVINGCPVQGSNIQPCYSSGYWWNAVKYWKLDRNQQRLYENVRNKYMTYDYCRDKSRFPTPPPECRQ